MTEKLYTLPAARLALYAAECVRRGHDFRIMVVELPDPGEPVAVVCDRCGREWKVQPA